MIQFFLINVMKKITFLICSLLFVGFSNAQQSKWAKDRPNVIIINIDDMGYGDTEPYGSTGYATPNFNKLAKEGMRFTHFYAAQAVCSPSRAALLTGCYPNRLGLAGALMPWSPKALNTKEETIATLLKKEGYVTGMLGKWHLGQKAPFLPLHFGFDTFYGIPYSHDMWPIDYEGKPIVDTTNWRIKFPPLPVLEGDKQIGTITSLDQQAELTATLTEKAEQFIIKNKNKAFFLYLAHPMPHVPLAVSSKFKGKSGAGLFGDVINEIDWSIGRVMEVLKKTGVDKNTLLIVTSDNGPWLTFGNHAGSSGGLREGKGTAWDGGTRVPCFIHWPAKVSEGTVCNQLLTNMDILPMVVAATQASKPKQKIDGLNFLPLLTGKTNQTPRNVFYVYYDANSLKVIRYKNWELVLPHTSQAYSKGTPGKDGIPGSTPVATVPMALYNLTHDPGTVYDVQNQFPEMVEEILRYAEQAREDLGDELTQRVGKNVRETGIVK
jgi:arylsulfatase A-like enzyme